MSRDDGFAVMDMSTDICNDPKFRKLNRLHNGSTPVAFMAYVAVIAESWKAGRRVTVEDAWPALLPYDGAISQAMADAGLLDRSGKIPIRAWQGWYDQAHKRRQATRDSWRRYNDKRRKHGEDAI